MSALLLCSLLAAWQHKQRSVAETRLSTAEGELKNLRTERAALLQEKREIDAAQWRQEARGRQEKSAQKKVRQQESPLLGQIDRLRAELKGFRTNYGVVSGSVNRLQRQLQVQARDLIQTRAKLQQAQQDTRDQVQATRDRVRNARIDYAMRANESEVVTKLAFLIEKRRRDNLHAPMPPSETSEQAFGPLTLCTTGIASSGVCCSVACGSCGYRGCTGQMSGQLECCLPRIIASGKPCRQPTDTACVLPEPSLGEEMRIALKVPSRGFSTCALVGSSGSLLHERFGAEVDRHDAVIRINNAPVHHFEPVVGSKTTIRVLNSQSIVAVLKKCSLPGRCDSNATCCPQGTVIVNSGRRPLYNCFRRVCGDAPSVQGMGGSPPLQRHPLLQSAPQRFRLATLSGVYALALAALLCTQRVDVYGFTLSRDDNNRNATYHYYDTCLPATNDPLALTADWIVEEVAGTSSVFRFRNASRRWPPYLGGTHISHHCAHKEDAGNYSQLIVSTPSTDELTTPTTTCPACYKRGLISSLTATRAWLFTLSAFGNLRPSIESVAES